jgi:prepilin-type N-terminal cleavage/methylation domain-containing protein
MYWMSFLRRGFSLVELMVAIGIILLLVTIVLASISQARESTRDKNRVADLARIEFAITLYGESHNAYPQFDEGVEVGVGNAIDAALSQYALGLRPDVKSSDGGGGEYAYIFDSNFTCSAEGQTVLIARTMERSQNANFEEICTDSMADTATFSGAYVKIIGFR